jgi:predicted Zn-dependent peptidase
VDTHVGGHRLTWTVEVPPENLDGALGHLGRSVARPTLSPAGWAAERTAAMQRAGAWSRDRPDAVVRELLTRALLGAGESTSRRAVVGTRSELSRIRHSHVASFYKAHVHPKRAWLLIVGPHPPADLVTRVDEAFAGLAKRSKRKLPATDAKATTLEGPPSTTPRRVFLIEDPKSDHATIYAVRWRSTCDAEGLDLVPVLDAATPHAHPFVLGPGLAMWTVRRVTTSAVVKAAEDAIADLDEIAISKKGFEHARARALTELSLRASDPSSLATWYRNLRHDLPDDHGAELGRRLQDAEVEAAATLLQGFEHARILVVLGDGDVLEQPLRALGEVQIIDPRRGFDVTKTLAGL